MGCLSEARAQKQKPWITPGLSCLDSNGPGRMVARVRRLFRMSGCHVLGAAGQALGCVSTCLKCGQECCMPFLSARLAPALLPVPGDETEARLAVQPLRRPRALGLGYHVLDAVRGNGKAPQTQHRAPSHADAKGGTVLGFW